MFVLLRRLIAEERAQDLAEYGVAFGRHRRGRWPRCRSYQRQCRYSVVERTEHYSEFGMTRNVTLTQRNKHIEKGVYNEDNHQEADYG